MISYSLIAKFAGGSPAASHFLLLRQEKVTQEKGRPGLGAAQRGAGRGAAAAFNNREPERRRLLQRTGLRLPSRSRPLVRRSFGLPCAARQAGRLPPKVTSFGARNSPSQTARGLGQSPPGAPDPESRNVERAGAPMAAFSNRVPGHRCLLPQTGLRLTSRSHPPDTAALPGDSQGGARMLPRFC